MAIGPPSEAPNWFCFSFGLACVDGAKKFRACSASLRLNSQAPPCHSLLPDLVTTLTTEPALRPYSAL